MSISLKSFQKLPRFFRRHKVISLLNLFGDPVCLIRVNDEFDAFIDARDGFARLIPIENEFEREFFALARVLLEPQSEKVFLDVGANYGLMSLGLSLQFTGTLQAHLFEANPYLCKIIRKSLLHNPKANCRLIEAAVMASSGNYTLNFDIRHSGAGHITEATPSGSVIGTTIDQYVSEAHLAQVDLLKIDVEGNESAVLQGASESLKNKVIRAVYFEYAPEQLARSGTPHDPIDLLLTSGYEVFHCREFDVGDSPTHTIGTGTRQTKLRRLRKPVETRITDLLALLPGTASPLL